MKDVTEMIEQQGWFSPKPIVLAGVGLALLQLGGCGYLKSRFPERGPEAQYKTATTLPPLEVPPDLLAGQSGVAVAVPGLNEAGGTTRYSTFAGGEGAASQPVPLEQPAFARMARSETGAGLLQVQEPFSAAWGHVAEALEAAEIEIKNMEQSLGFYEVAYEPVNPPEKSLLQKINLFSGDTVRYRVVLSDKVEWTAITVRDEEGARDSTDSAYEMLTAIGQNYPVQAAQSGLQGPLAGVLPDTLTSSSTLTRTANGSAELTLKSDFARAWREIGMALAKAEIKVEDRDRSSGVYYVEVVNEGESKGLFSGMKSLVGLGGGEQKFAYLLALTEEDGATSVVVFDEDEKLERSEAAYQLLEQLREYID